MILIRDIKLVRGTIRTLVGLLEEIEVSARDGFSVHDHVDSVAQAGDIEVIPFPGGFHGVFQWLNQVVDGAGIVVAGRLGVIDGNLDAVKADIFAGTRSQRGRPDKYAAVAAGTDFEVEREQKLGPLLGVDEHVMSALMRVE